MHALLQFGQFLFCQPRSLQYNILRLPKRQQGTGNLSFSFGLAPCLSFGKSVLACRCEYVHVVPLRYHLLIVLKFLLRTEPGDLACSEESLERPDPQAIRQLVQPPHVLQRVTPLLNQADALLHLFRKPVQFHNTLEILSSGTSPVHFSLNVYSDTYLSFHSGELLSKPISAARMPMKYTGGISPYPYPLLLPESYTFDEYSTHLLKKCSWRDCCISTMNSVPSVPVHRRSSLTLLFSGVKPGISVVEYSISDTILLSGSTTLRKSIRTSLLF